MVSVYQGRGGFAPAPEETGPHSEAAPSAEDSIHQNARDLEAEFAWFRRVLQVRFELFFGEKCRYSDVLDLAPPELQHSASPYARWITQTQLAYFERLALVLALVPHVRPQLADAFLTKNEKRAGRLEVGVEHRCVIR